MRILMVSWEYPPKVIGGLARAVSDLAEALVEQGHEVSVVTSDHPESGQAEYVSGVRVYRVNQHYPSPLGFLDSVLYMNYHLIQRAVQIISAEKIDVIHAHDWLVAPAAKVLKHTFNLPLVATIHATEWGRSGGLHNDLQRHISDVEWWLTYEAYRVICCSEYMREELRRVFHLPDDKVSVIPNGVVVNKFRETHPDLDKFRSQWALPEERIVFFIGRHVYEKGVDVLLGAVPKVLAHQPNAKFIIAGTGPMHHELKHRAHQMGIAHKVLFAGFIDDVTRNSLYQLADAAVFPSRYEPFGIVALEAMAAGAPVVVSDVGGFREIVRHGETGLTFYAGQSNSLADNILTLLCDRQYAKMMRSLAYRELLERFDWSKIALQTVEEYNRALGKAPSPMKDTKDIYGRYHLTGDFPEERAELYESSNHGRR
ncbi:MAG TPA: glycosyltransferase family 4 protein [Firmicutes bacterium]|nr:glycosyltransferase family 4 protein [Bacillota bacterium]